MRARTATAVASLVLIAVGFTVLYFPPVVAEWTAAADGGGGPVNLRGGIAYGVFVWSSIPYGRSYDVSVTIARAADNATLWAGTASFVAPADPDSRGGWANQWLGDLVLPADGAIRVWWRLSGDLPTPRPVVRLATPVLPSTLAWAFDILGFAGFLVFVFWPFRPSPEVSVVVSRGSGRSEPFPLSAGRTYRILVTPRRGPQDGLPLDVAVTPANGGDAAWSGTVLLGRAARGKALEGTFAAGAEGDHVVTWKAGVPLPLAVATVRIVARKKK